MDEADNFVNKNIILEASDDKLINSVKLLQFAVENCYNYIKSYLTTHEKNA